MTLLLTARKAMGIKKWKTAIVKVWEELAALDSRITDTEEPITAAKMLVLSSAEETATGSEQEITHALGAAPTIVAVVPTLITVDDTVDYSVTYGTHTTTKVKVTVAPAGSKFKIFAIA